MKTMHGTTILGMYRNGHTAIGGDGQVTLGSCVIKSRAIKIRRIFDNKVVIGFAGATADALTLIDKFEERLKTYKGNIRKAAVDLAKEWRCDKYLRRLDALMIAGDNTGLLMISGVGDVLESDDGIIAIGSGGNYALSAARALVANTNLSNSEIILQSLNIAADICVYTNRNIIIEEI